MNDVKLEYDYGEDLIAPTQTGRPRVSYDIASEASKRRMKTEAKTAVHELLDKCNEISKGCGQQLLRDVVKKTPLGNIQTQNSAAQKVDNMINDLRKSYNQENQSSSDKIRLLSTIAGHFTNKELKKAFPCSDYELTQARRDTQNLSELVLHLNQFV